MTPTSIGRLTLAQQTADAQGPSPHQHQLKAAASPEQPSASASPEQLKAAKDFEAIFIRQLLSSLEKSSGISGGDKSGGAVFRSMMVSALADTAAEGGGIGLRDLITRAMLPPAPQGRPNLSRAAQPESPSAAFAPATSPPATSLDGSFRFEAFEGSIAAEQAGPRLDRTSLDRVSDRLGVTGRVLTMARPSPMLSGVAAGGETPPTRPEGNR
jgi:Rod binding domain-containing protein